MSDPTKTVFEEYIEYTPTPLGACAIYVDKGDEEWTIRFNLCTPLDSLLETHQEEDGFVEEENRPFFEAMKLDLQLMLARIERLKFR
jgi:hypothetical protein